MSALTRVLRELAEEGTEIAAATRRFLAERFGDTPDTPTNAARVRQAAQRAEPARPRAADFVVPARAQTPAQPRRRAPTPTPAPLAARQQRPLAARPTAAPAEQPLALPAPAEPLPDFAAKPRGGQWWVDQEINGVNFSPERAARLLTPRPYSTEPQDVALQDWWNRALTRYLRNDFATANDPLRGLAEQGLLHTDLSPEEWSTMAGRSFIEDRIGPDIVLPNNSQGGLPGAGDAFHAEVLQAMPWLARQPMTDNIYGMSSTSLGGLDFSHVADEMYNAMRPETSGIPADLAVRPESLQRMAFPQAVERVGRINQWRTAQQAEASLAAQNNPALRLYRDYAEDNPRGLRWMEIAPSQMTDLPEGYELAESAISRAGMGDEPTPFYRVFAPDGETVAGEGYSPELAREEALRYAGRDPLQQALRYEGDTMGHCVGGYCDDVLSGRSRIFSLRDARGEPHVTVEARPGRPRTALSEIPRDALDQITEAATADTNAVAGPMGIGPDDPRWTRTYQTNLALKQREWLSANPTPDDIIQIKGKQNRAPNDEYLPFVQDFVRQGQWGNVGDLGNTGLVRLPDGRYITQAQREEGMRAAQPALDTYYGGRTGQPYWNHMNDYSSVGDDVWQQLAPYFQGYAVGGRVDADRCFCNHPFSAKR